MEIPKLVIERAAKWWCNKNNREGAWDRADESMKDSYRVAAESVFKAAFVGVEVVDCRSKDGFKLDGTLGVTVALKSGDTLLILRAGGEGENG